MISILSFPDFGCGGLFCSLFNQTQIMWSKDFKDTIRNKEHDALKIGANYQDRWAYDKNKWNRAVEDCEKKFAGKFCGTHIPLTDLPNLDTFERKIQICTQTFSSRLILWMRAHHLIYLPKFSINDVTKQKEFSKDFVNLIVEPHKDAINIELGNYMYDKKYRQQIHSTHNLNFDQKIFNEWKHTNHYIFDLQKSNIVFQIFYNNIKKIN